MVYNVNVGVLGHVDSGKTSLVRKLSTVLSTAALDKHPQSQERGITLDLGFSSLQLAPEIQLTLVDCPGHASLFKTILTGLQIIDMVLLVVDATKGLQPQTMECLVLAQQVVQKNLVIVINKVDLIQPRAMRPQRIQQVTTEIHAFLHQSFPTVFETLEIAAVKAPIVTVCTKEPDGEDAPDLVAKTLDTLVQTLRATIRVPQRDPNGAFAFAIDHCFGVSGGGTILTGTVLNGTIHINDQIWFPQLQVTKKIKSIQMFRQNVTRAIQGDRIGMRVHGLDASLLERGVGLSPNNTDFATKVHNLIINFQPAALFQQPIKSGTKVHVTIGHVTVMATLFCFRNATTDPTAPKDASTSFAVHNVYDFVEEIMVTSHDDVHSDPTCSATKSNTGTQAQPQTPHFVLLRLEQPVLCHHQAMVVCSRLDLDPKRFACRVAFFGQVQCFVTYDDDLTTTTTTTTTVPSSSPLLQKTRVVAASQLQIGKVKEKTGIVEKVLSHHHHHGHTPCHHDQQVAVIVRDLFGKETDLQVFVGLKVLFHQCQRLGRMVGSFGKAGKCRIELVADDEADNDNDNDNDTSELEAIPSVGEQVILRFRKHLLRGKRTKKQHELHQEVHVVYPEWSAARHQRQRARRALAADQQQLQPVDATCSSSTATSSSSASSSSTSSTLLQGTIERLKGETSREGKNPFVIVTGMFDTLELAQASVGQEIWFVNATTGHQEVGIIEKPFGKAGKIRGSFEQSNGTSAQIGDLVFGSTAAT